MSTGTAVAAVVTLRPAREADLPQLLALVNGYAARNLLLSRSQASLRTHLHEFTVAGAGDVVLACGALATLGPGLAEVRTLAVREDAIGRGLGHAIVERLVAQAEARGFAEVLTLTRRLSFFQALGFVVTRRERFLDKLEADCRFCPLAASCDEVALVKPVRGGGIVKEGEADS